MFPISLGVNVGGRGWGMGERGVRTVLMCGKWKDRSADGPVSAKKPRKVKERQREEGKVRERGMDEGTKQDKPARPGGHWS